MLSVDAVQLRFTRTGLCGVAVRPVGTDGACVSEAVTVTVFEKVAPNQATPSRTIRQSVVWVPGPGAVIVKVNVYVFPGRTSPEMVCRVADVNGSLSPTAPSRNAFASRQSTPLLRKVTLTV